MNMISKLHEWDRIFWTPYIRQWTLSNINLTQQTYLEFKVCPVLSCKNGLLTSRSYNIVL
jgi:hypothetical protein